MLDWSQRCLISLALQAESYATNSLVNRFLLNQSIFRHCDWHYTAFDLSLCFVLLHGVNVHHSFCHLDVWQDVAREQLRGIDWLLVRTYTASLATARAHLLNTNDLSL